MESISAENELLETLGVGSRRIRMMSPSVMRRIVGDCIDGKVCDESDTYEVDCRGSELGDRIISIPIKEVVEGLLD